ncbi:penicillin-binding protein 2 [Oxynema sp. CENA135]|uniref:penicillin-binding protein 2 n=1 Tax=Oxynema sp. CENA135 TaxID=984206 RepID=UPI00190DB744|nr:penicillin-binding protein 2 [Oxynema sp. CENA135]MBK4728395.1 penicillin-binding protein 2 [Oxynema sp. CENA135]
MISQQFFSSVVSSGDRAHRSQVGRAIVIMLVVTSLIGACLTRLAQLQLVEGDYHQQRAEENRIRLVPVPAARGAILDRQGKILAANRLSRSVYVWPQEQSPEDWYTTATKLAPILKLPVENIVERIEQMGYRSAMPVRVSQNLSQEAFVALGERADEFPGLEIRVETSRQYPQGSLAAHVLGYISEANAEDLKAHPEYPMGITIGKTGIERALNDYLTGKWGNLLIEVNAQGEELRELGMRSPESGKSVQLTLDLAVQKTAEMALGDRQGAVVALDVNTGGILAMASHSTFDPNIFTRPVKAAEWEHLQAPENPLLNRALQGYPPGSTFKIVTAAAGIESGTFSPDVMLATSSYITVGGFQFHEHSGGYGTIGIRDALAYSSNTFFYQMGLAAGPEAISKWGKLLGIGTNTDLEFLGLDGGQHGSIPTPEEKQELYGQPWYAGDTVTMAIGQGLVLVTPLELAVMVGTVANGGNRIKPHLLTSQTNTPETKPIPTGIAPETIAVIKEGLTAVVQKGTARRLNDGTIPLTAGKTGTSEVIGQPSHALYVAFGPAVKPEIAIAVVVENGGYGGVAAAPIAHEIFKTYFNGTTPKTSAATP